MNHAKPHSRNTARLHWTGLTLVIFLASAHRASAQCSTQPCPPSQPVEIDLTLGSSENSACAIDGVGRFSVVWLGPRLFDANSNQYDANANRVVVRYFLPDGSAPLSGGPFPVTIDTTNTCRHDVYNDPSIAMNHSGGIRVGFTGIRIDH